MLLLALGFSTQKLLTSPNAGGWESEGNTLNLRFRAGSGTAGGAAGRLKADLVSLSHRSHRVHAALHAAPHAAWHASVHASLHAAAHAAVHAAMLAALLCVFGPQVHRPSALLGTPDPHSYLTPPCAEHLGSQQGERPASLSLASEGYPACKSIERAADQARVKI